MKRIVSIILVACLLLGLVAGISISAFAAEEVTEIHITGLNAPELGGSTDSPNLSGVPEGFDVELEWYRYDYTENYFDGYEAATVTNSGIYRLDMWFTAQSDAYLSYEAESFTINGEPVNLAVHDQNDQGITRFYLSNVYIVGDVTMIDEISLEQVPEEAAGADVNGFKVADGCGCSIESVDWYAYPDYNSYDGATLEDGILYEAILRITPQEGYWISPDAVLYAPKDADNYYVGDTLSYLDANFTYDLRPSVDEVNVIGDFTYAYGDPATDEGLSIPADANYSMEVQWYAGDQEITGDLGYDRYEVEVRLTPNDGYFFRDDTAICVNGEEINYDDWSYYISEDEIALSAQILIAPDNGFVEEVVLSGNPDSISAGAAVSAPELTVDSGEVTVTKTQWVDETYEPVSGKFESGKIYYLAVTMKADEGYGLSSDYTYASVTVGGREGFYGIGKNADGTATVYIRYSLKKMIESAEVTVAEPVIGGTPAEPKVPGGANYTVADYYWYEGESGDEVTTFESGKKYYVDVTLAPADGCEFIEYMELTVNGEEPYHYYNDVDYACIVQRYSFQKSIDRIDITMPEPELGGVYGIEYLELPEDANYSIDMEQSYWQAYNGEVTGTFEKDRYYLSVMLTANAGYEFAEDAVVYINGVEAEDYSIYGDGSLAGAGYEISFLEQIHKVELPAFPTIQLGDMLESYSVDAPEGANYSIAALWLEYTGDMESDEYNGPAQDKSVYYLAYTVVPNAGYEFADDVIYTVDGKAVTTGVHYAYNNYLTVAKMYSFGMKLISKVELTVQTPVKDAEPGEISIPKDANYEILDSSWAVSDTDAVEDTQSMEGKFQNNKYYWIQASLQAKEGYVFAEDAVITVNGKVVDMSEFTALTGMPATFGDIAFAYYNLGKVGGSTMPDTGDSSTVILMTVLAVLSGTALAATAFKKKKAF